MQDPGRVRIMSEDKTRFPPEEPFDEAAAPFAGAEASVPTDDAAAEPTESRRAMRRYRKSDVEVDEGEDDDGEILVVSLRLRSAGKKRPVEIVEQETRPKVTRFGSKTGAPIAAPLAAPSGPGPTSEGTPLPPAAAPLKAFTPRTTPGTAEGHDRQRHTFLWRALSYVAVAAAASVVALVVSRNAAHADAVAVTNQNSIFRVPKLTGIWSPVQLSKLDAVLEADQKGDLKNAWQLANELTREAPDKRDLELYLSTVQVRQGQYDDAETDVVKMIDAFTPPREAAAVNEHLGFVYARHRDLAHAVASFADAAGTDPFNPDHFQHWGEGLRRQGQLQAAVDRFEQALLRLHAGQSGAESQRQEIEFKIALSKIELTRDEDVKAAIDTHRREPAPDGYWLLTAAAYALQHGDVQTAVDALRQARRALSTETYAALTNDYFFHPFADRKELAGLLPADTPAERTQPFRPRMGYFIDP